MYVITVYTVSTSFYKCAFRGRSLLISTFKISERNKTISKENTVLYGNIFTIPH